MSRSVKHTPISGICSYKPGTMQEWKRGCNRALRSAVRRAMGRDVLPVMKELRNPWTSPSDGKMWFDPNKHPELMRK